MSELRVRQVQREHPTLQTSRFVVASRPSLHLDYDSPWGLCKGEAAPLPGYGNDSLERARANLQAWSPKGIDACIESLWASWAAQEKPLPAAAWEELHSALDVSEISPSARFAVDQVVTQALSHRAGLPAHRLLGQGAVASRLALSQVLSPLQPGEMRRAEQFFAEGVRTFKLKCGSAPDSELRFAREVASFGKELRLRVDANGNFTRDEVLRFSAALGEQLEWIEDPTLDPRQWSRWPEQDGPLAVDEPLVGRGSESALPAFGFPGTAAEASESAFSAQGWGRRLRAVVLKPMALGGWAPCLRWASAAGAAGAQVCVSHLFDGPRAAWGCATLAFAVQSPEVAVGLSRHVGLSGAEQQLPWLTADALLLGPLEDAFPA